MKNKLFYFAILLFSVSNINAQNITFDKTFGSTGGLKTNLFYLDIGKLIALQANEKILTAGPDIDTSALYKNIFFVKRVNKNGTIDTSFGKNGLVSIKTITGSKVDPINMILQPDEKILILSALADNNGNRSTIHRLNPNGSNDNTFGKNGVIEIGVDKSGAQLYQATVLADGSIVGVGQIYENKNIKTGLLVEKYDKNGILDITFGKAGRFTYFTKDSLSLIGTQIGTQKKDGAHILYVTSNDEFLASNAFLYKIDSKGNLDKSFGDLGVAVVDELTDENLTSTMTILPNDTILVLNDGANSISILQQFLPNGRIDNSFATNSKLILDNQDTQQTFYDFVVTPDQKFLLSGSMIDLTNKTIGLLARYNKNGTLDKSFGNKGRLELQFANSITYFNNLLLLKNSKIVCNGVGFFDTDNQIGLFQIDPLQFVSTSNVATDIKKINIFPNPVTNQATLSIELTSAQNLDIQLFDINGRRVSDFRTTNDVFAAGKNEIQLDLPESLSSGTYFVNIRSQEGISVVKMLKM